MAVVEEARAVLERLDRIARLEREHVPADVLLGEVRALLAEAEVWSRREGAGGEAVERCRAALAEGGVPLVAR